MKLALELPLAIVMAAGTVSAAWFDEIATVTPWLGAGPPRLTTTLTELPAITVDEAGTTLLTVGRGTGFTVSLTVNVPTVMAAFAGEVMDALVTAVNDAVELPPGTVMLAGTVTEASFDEIDTGKP